MRIDKFENILKILKNVLSREANSHSIVRTYPCRH